MMNQITQKLTANRLGIRKRVTILACTVIASLATTPYLAAQTAASRSGFGYSAANRSYSAAANTAGSRYISHAASSEASWFDVKIALTKVEVLNDGDQGDYLSGGEMYWKVYVSHPHSSAAQRPVKGPKQNMQQDGLRRSVLSHVSRERHCAVSSGQTYGIKQLDRMASPQRFRLRRGELFWLRVEAGEADQLSADDLLAPIQAAAPLSVYRPVTPNSPSSRIVREYRFKHGSQPAVRLHFTLTALPAR